MDNSEASVEDNELFEENEPFEDSEPSVEHSEAYVVAVRRDKREVVGDDWLDQVSARGATVVGESELRAQITATPEVAERIDEDLGDYIMIEPVIEHHTLTELERT